MLYSMRSLFETSWRKRRIFPRAES